jgi:hypothetical protein
MSLSGSETHPCDMLMSTARPTKETVLNQRRQDRGRRLLVG